MQYKVLKSFAQWAKKKTKNDYNWFIRLIIIRFMEANLYIEPELKNCINNFNNKVSNSVEFKNIFLKQWNKISVLMHEIFPKVCINDIGSFPFDISCKENDVAYYLYNDIAEEYFTVLNGASVNVVGWLYEYFNLDDKSPMSSLCKGTDKICKEKIPSMTQIFTPAWIAEQLIHNSLMKFSSDETICIGDIKCFDPCMGCGHILTAIFDYLMKLYVDKGYSKEKAAISIIENNLYGLDIDDRVYKIAYFSLMMKVVEYVPSIWETNIRPHVYCIHESNYLNCEYLKYFGYGLDNELRNEALYIINGIINKFTDAREYGSLINIEEFDLRLVNQFLNSTDNLEITKFYASDEVATFKESFNKILCVAILLSKKYNAVITNPPYLSKRVYNSKLSSFLNKNYAICKYDLYAAFIYKCIEDFCCENGYVAMVTIHSWMFISSFEKLRKHILNNYYITNMIHLGAGAFEAVNSFNALTTAFCIKKCNNQKNSVFIKLTDFIDTKGKIKNLDNSVYRYNVDQDSFKAIDGCPFVYWMSDNERNIFRTVPSIKNSITIKQGMATSDNKRFLRYWYEVPFDQIGFNIRNLEEAKSSCYKWFPYNKGGNFRKWYGNNELVVNWENGGDEIKQYTATLNQGTSVRVKSQEYYFKEGITWSLFGFENFGVRYKENGYIFDISGSSMFPEKKYLYYLLSFLCSSVAFKFLTYLAPTINFQIKNIGDLPLIIEESYLNILDKLALECIEICKEEWDEYEQSWNFKRHPFLQYPLFQGNMNSKDNILNNTEAIVNYTNEQMLNIWKQLSLQEIYTKWEEYTLTRYNRLKSNEEQINRIFIDIYKLNNVIDYKVANRDVSVKKASLQKTIRNLISYGVGCAVGRYSPYSGKLIYKEGSSIIIFREELLNRVLLFIKVIFGDEHFQNNISFIAKGLYYDNPSKYSNLQPIEVIKKYFDYDFIKEHTKTYKNHPIYIVK